jgi:hypothetical protein
MGKQKRVRAPAGDSREPSRARAVQEDVRHPRVEPGSPPDPRFAEEERRLLAQFFVLLDQMDRAHAARNQRKEAA